jgi:hypothetical protein
MLIILVQDKNTSLKLSVGVYPLQLVNLHRNRRYFVIKLHTWFYLSYILKTNIKFNCIYQYVMSINSFFNIVSVSRYSHPKQWDKSRDYTCYSQWPVTHFSTFYQFILNMLFNYTHEQLRGGQQYIHTNKTCSILSMSKTKWWSYDTMYKLSRMDTLPLSPMDTLPLSTIDTIQLSTMDTLQLSTMDKIPLSLIDTFNCQQWTHYNCQQWTHYHCQQWTQYHCQQWTHYHCLQWTYYRCQQWTH